LEPGHEGVSVRGHSYVGEVDLYISRCPLPSGLACLIGGHYPNTTHYDAATAGTGNKFLSLDRADLAATVYIIGVASHSMYAEYRLSYNLRHVTVRLQAGQPETDFVDQVLYAVLSYN
jgi:hypothetical protein